MTIGYHKDKEFFLVLEVAAVKTLKRKEKAGEESKPFRSSLVKASKVGLVGWPREFRKSRQHSRQGMCSVARFFSRLMPTFGQKTAKILPTFFTF